MPVIAERISLDELKEAGSFLQTALWGRFKQAFGWKALAVKWRSRDESGTLLILLKDLLPGLSLAYLPMGPDLNAGQSDREGFLIDLARELRGILPLGTFFLRYDLPDSCGVLEERPVLDHPFVKASLDIQPPDTVVIDLTREEETLLADMHKKTRYNIRLAEKKGVWVEVAGLEKLPDWYELYRITAQRDKIGIHGYRYYEKLFRLMEEDSCGGKLSLYLAYCPEGELLAGIIVLLRGTEAVYLYGASSNDKRNLMPAYALQWQAMREAKQYGCRDYDMYGIPPADEPDHPMHGLYRFKTGFGGEIRRRPGAWDYPYSKLMYTLYRGVENLRYYYYKKWKKRH